MTNAEVARFFRARERSALNRAIDRATAEHMQQHVPKPGFDQADQAMDEAGHLGRCVMRGGVVIESDLSTQPGYGQDRASRASFAITDHIALREQCQRGE